MWENFRNYRIFVEYYYIWEFLFLFVCGKHKDNKILPF